MSTEVKINVDEIMQQIRADIKTSGADKIPLSFAEQAPVAGASIDVSSCYTGKNDELSKAVTYLSTHYEIPAYEILTGNKIKVFFKKACRKLSAFFVLPIVRQQNILNYHYFRAAEAVAVQASEVDAMKKTADELEARLASLENAQNKDKA